MFGCRLSGRERALRCLEHGAQVDSHRDARTVRRRKQEQVSGHRTVQCLQLRAHTEGVLDGRIGGRLATSVTGIGSSGGVSVRLTGSMYAIDSNSTGYEAQLLF